MYCIYNHGDDRTPAGWVEFDHIRAYTSTPTQAGALLNPDFEVQPFDVFTNVQYWTPFGNAGVVATNLRRNGRASLQIWYQNNWMGQTWPATAGKKYRTQAYAMTPSSDRLRGSTNAAIQALVSLEFFDSSGNMIGNSFPSAGLMTNSTPDTWTLLTTEGFAPVGTVTGRTIMGILGTDDGFGGTVFFDDVDQQQLITGATTNGLLINYGFDDGPTGDAYFLSNSLPRWTWYGGSNAGFVVSDVSRDGGQSLTVVWPNNLAGQDFAAKTGLTYIAEGYVLTPSANKMTSETAYATILLEFFNNVSGIQTSVSVASTLNLTKDTPADTWVKLSVTNRAPWVGTWVTGRVSCALLDDADGAGFGGQVYFDTLKVSVTTVAVANSQSGALWNPGFEYTAKGTKFSFIDNWKAFGDAGGVVETYKRSGNNALQIYYVNNLLAQDWPATAGTKYRSQGYAMTPSGDRISGTNGLQAVVIQQYLDSDGDPIGESSVSSGLLTNSAADTWTLLTAEGWAPVGTVTCRTFVALLNDGGPSTGSVYFDDLSQSVIASGATTNGLLVNYGFDDGPTGDAYFLSNSLPRWTWYGGSNAGFVVSDVSRDGGQSLTVVWPNNLAGQDFAARTGLTYIAEGYVLTPSANKMTSETAYATILLEFFNNVSGIQTSVSVASTLNLTKDTPADTWVKLSVTNRAPWVGTWVTGRVSCALLDDADGAGFGGQVYFDTLKVSVTTVAVANSQSGALWNPGFEYTAKGTKFSFIDNWKAFGDAGGVVETYKRSGNNALQIYYVNNLLAQDWPATAGYRYKSQGYAFTPAADRLSGTNGLQALVILQYLDTNGNAIGDSFVSQGLTTNSTPDQWTLLTAEGWAPAGTVTGRTFVALLNDGGDSMGSVYFDDLAQSLVSTGGTSQSGLLFNPGFEDGPTGNAYDLYQLGWLPAWKWGGGDNAGFIGTDYAYQGEQALVITYPQNAAYQDFTVSSAGSTGNLLENPGFEIGAAGGATPQGWWKDGQLGQEWWAAETGTNGVAFYSWTTGNWGFMGQDVSVDLDDGSVFTFSVRALAETNYSSSASETYIKMEFWADGEGSYRYAVTNSIYNAMVANPNTWNTYTLAHTNTDSEVNLVKVLFGYGNATDTGGNQAAKWDNASLVQSVDLSESKTYIASGYLFTPSSSKFSTDGSSYGELTLSFYVNGSSDPAQEFTAHSAPFGGDRPADQWIYFCVTGQAPAEAVVTGRLSCTIFSGDPSGDFDLGGVIWFDGFTVIQSGSQTGVTAFSQWQLQNFGSTTGPDTGPDDDYDRDGFVNWSEFVAGTQPTNISSFLSVEAQQYLPGKFIVRWPSVTGREYALRRYTNLVSGSYSVIASDIAATPPTNVYTDSVPSAVQSYYYRVTVTNSP
ncbi:MAG: Carbohydrate binding domain protein [Verrucomicrobia bacterium ADurb.Bin345]|nr:MAG: Carbohydrate binding domain protein [Verrucomicrobia bacterium ADurb.Bin345]